LVELPSPLATLGGGDAVDAHPWVGVAQPTKRTGMVQKPECRRFKSCPPD